MFVIVEQAARQFPGIRVYDKLPEDKCIPFCVFPIREDLPDVAPQTRLIAYGDIGYIAFAFALGCADYMRDPWYPEELFYRCLRFCPHGRYISWKGVYRLTEPDRLESNGQTAILSSKQFAIFNMLMLKQGQLVTREEAAKLLGNVELAKGRAVDMQISSLRNILIRMQGPKGYDDIQTVHGKGYRMNLQC